MILFIINVFLLSFINLMLIYKHLDCNQAETFNNKQYYCFKNLKVKSKKKKKC